MNSVVKICSEFSPPVLLKKKKQRTSMVLWEHKVYRYILPLVQWHVELISVFNCTGERYSCSMICGVQCTTASPVWLQLLSWVLIRQDSAWTPYIENIPIFWLQNHTYFMPSLHFICIWDFSSLQLPFYVNFHCFLQPSIFWDGYVFSVELIYQPYKTNNK